jgi:transcription regulator MmyB-like protein
LPRGRKDRDAEQIRIDEEMLAGRDPLAHRRQVESIAPGRRRSRPESRTGSWSGERPYASFFDDLEAIAMEDRNILWLVFTQSDWRVTIVDWDDVVGRLVAEFRAAMAEHLDDAAYVEGGSSPGCSAPDRSSPPSGSGTTSRALRAARSALGTRP